MRPFMTSAPFGSSCEAKSLDRDVFLVSKSSKPKMQPRNRFHMPLPPEIIQMIYDFLEDDDVINLSRVIYIGPCPEWWEQLRAKYMLPDDSDIQANMTTLVENLRKMPQSRYPKTVNYRTIWKNMELVRDTMRYPTVWHELSATAPVGHHMILENNGNSSRFSIHLPERLYLVLIFAESEGVQFLCGIILNGLLIGHEEGTWSPVSVNSFRGLRAFSIKDGFVGIQVNDFGAWKTQWHGGYPPASSHTQLQLEWNSPDYELVISYDVCLIFKTFLRLTIANIQTGSQNHRARNSFWALIRLGMKNAASLIHQLSLFLPESNEFSYNAILNPRNTRKFPILLS